MNEKKLKKLKNIYFTHIDEKDINYFHDIIIQVFDVNNTLKNDDLYNIFMLLPQEIFGLIIMWDMNDTEVGDTIYEYLDKNKDEIRKKLNLN